MEVIVKSAQTLTLQASFQTLFVQNVGRAESPRRVMDFSCVDLLMLTGGSPTRHLHGVRGLGVL